MNSTDNWFAAPGCEGEWTVYDENRLPVAYCGDRRDDAETIARDHNAFGPMLEALRATLPALTVLGDYIGNEYRKGHTASGTESFDRCAIILQVKDAIRNVTGEPT